MMWLLYGLPAVTPDNMLIITINVIGITIELHYIALFLAYSVGAARRRVLLILVAEVTFVSVVAVLVLNLTHTHTHRSMVVGILCVFFEAAMYAAPLSVMVRIDPYHSRHLLSPRN
jgi:solute carrier family 50 protein (sugar transporter)